MAATGNLSSSSGSSKKRKRDERRVLVDEALKISTTSSTNNCHLPPKIVEEILSLLPNKSIHRFRSVSKSWSSMLVSVDFHQFRCKSTLPEKTIPRVLRFLGSCSLSEPSPSHRFVVSSYYPVVASSNSTGKTTSADPLPIDDTKECYPFQKFWHRRFVGSCNGLVCLEHSLSKPAAKNHYPNLETVVWNPFTGLCRKLPHHVSCSDDGIYAYGFGYDSASDDYKVFKATCPDYGGGVRVHIFSLKAGS
ncbi:hypothetical protein Tsubulata_046350 [Turnera subulata]|uniref:F-box domain-containing protein n=1 Tax=Turnera subulata TaxID=218843 RepID=A0A9Q0JP69_9ROSI|nr:hypothetical protein Tsubulata_046350 [Turnera subulata]